MSNAAVIGAYLWRMHFLDNNCRNDCKHGGYAVLLRRQQPIDKSRYSDTRPVGREKSGIYLENKQHPICSSKMEVEKVVVRRRNSDARHKHLLFCRCCRGMGCMARYDDKQRKIRLFSGFRNDNLYIIELCRLRIDLSALKPVSYSKSCEAFNLFGK